MKRLLRPKPLFALALVLAAAIAAFAIWRAGWLSGGEELNRLYWQQNSSWRFQLEGSALIYGNTPEPSGLPRGEVAGTVTDCGNPLLQGQTAYYPEGATDRSTVLVEWLPYGWCSFYCRALDLPPVASGEPPDAVFDGFGLPDSLLSGSLSGGGNVPEASFSAEHLAELIDLLSCTENQGQAGLLAASNEQKWPNLAKTGTRRLTLENKDGCRLTIEYYPRLGGVALWDGYYPIPAERIPALEALLYPEA